MFGDLYYFKKMVNMYNVCKMFFFFIVVAVDILDDMLAGIGWTMQDYFKHQENDYHPPLKNGHRVFLHDIRRVAVRSAVAMGEEGDVVVSTRGG